MFTHCEGIYLTGFPGQIATHEKILRNGMSRVTLKKPLLNIMSQPLFSPGQFKWGKFLSLDQEQMFEKWLGVV